MAKDFPDDFVDPEESYGKVSDRVDKLHDRWTSLQYEWQKRGSNVKEGNDKLHEKRNDTYNQLAIACLEDSDKIVMLHLNDVTYAAVEDMGLIKFGMLLRWQDILERVDKWAKDNFEMLPTQESLSRFKYRLSGSMSYSNKAMEYRLSPLEKFHHAIGEMKHLLITYEDTSTHVRVWCSEKGELPGETFYTIYDHVVCDDTDYSVKESGKVFEHDMTDKGSFKLTADTPNDVSFSNSKGVCIDGGYDIDGEDTVEHVHVSTLLLYQDT